jgi:hypothetical protein
MQGKSIRSSSVGMHTLLKIFPENIYKGANQMYYNPDFFFILSFCNIAIQLSPTCMELLFQNPRGVLKKPDNTACLISGCDRYCIAKLGQQNIRY